MQKHIWKTSAPIEEEEAQKEEDITDFPRLIQISIEIAELAPVILVGENAAPHDKDIRVTDVVKHLELLRVDKLYHNLCYTYVIVAKNGIMTGLKETFKEEMKQQKSKMDAETRAMKRGR